MGREASGVGRGDGRPAGGSRYAATRATTPGAPGTRYVVLRDTSPLGARNRKPGGQASRTALRPHTRPAISSSGNVLLAREPRDRSKGCDGMACVHGTRACRRWGLCYAVPRSDPEATMLHRRRFPRIETLFIVLHASSKHSDNNEKRPYRGPRVAGDNRRRRETGRSTLCPAQVVRSTATCAALRATKANTYTRLNAVQQH